MEELTQQQMNQLRSISQELKRFSMMYKFALDEMNTKINILKEEFQQIHEYSPIEHCNSRIKTPESIFKKVHRKNLTYSLDEIREQIRDIAGIRIVCPFISDVYKISEMIQKQRDVEVVHCKDYIRNPKPNGYQSLHLIVKIPVFMSDRVEKVYVELQIRTIAMDFWASLEHKIYYKYNKEIPEWINHDLKEAATVASELDAKMEKINHVVSDLKKQDQGDHLLEFNDQRNISSSILESIFQHLLKK